MAITRSDNRQENHAKPVQNGERKFVSGSFIDYTDIADVLANTVEAYRSNKYFWVDGTLYHFYTATDYRAVSSSATGAVTAILLIVGTGTPSQYVDGYISAGNSIQHTLLNGSKRVCGLIISGTSLQSFLSTDPTYCPLVEISPGVNAIDVTAIGGVVVGNWIQILTQNI